MSYHPSRAARLTRSRKIPHEKDAAIVLLEKVKQRDTAAFEALYVTYAARVHSYALQLLRDPHAAEDVTHEVFVRIWRYAGSYDAARSPRPDAWMFQIVRNQAINELGARSRTVSAETIGPADESEWRFAALDIQELDAAHDRADCRSIRFRQSVAALPSHYRQVMFLRFQHDLSNPEIAERLGVPVGTVKTWLRRSLIRLRSQLKVTLPGTLS